MAASDGRPASTLDNVHVAREEDLDGSLPEGFLVPKSVCLASDPSTSLSVAYEPEQTSDKRTPLIVFLNGLVLPASSFTHSIALFLRRIRSGSDGARRSRPGLLVWDRYGQGLSQKQAARHDALDVVETLNELLRTFVGQSDDGIHSRPLVLVGNSIGCPLARLFVEKHGHAYNVQGLLLLDSMIANTDFVSLFDEPATTIGDEERVALQHAREVMRATFHPSCPNVEGFDRSQMAQQVPFSDRPALPRMPYITVLGHDHAFFAQDSERRLGIPAWIVQKYMNAKWDQYNEGLIQLTDKERARGPIRPPDSGHFIQVSRPDVVADELVRLCDLISVR